MGSRQFRFDNLEHPLVLRSFILYVYSNVHDLHEKQSRLPLSMANDQATIYGEGVQKTEGKRDTTMRKLFTIDDIMVAFVAAFGYGFGYTLSKHFGWPELVCIAICLVLGMASERIVSRIIFSKSVQKKMTNRVIAYAACLLVFLVSHIVSVLWLNSSMFVYLGEQFLYVIGLPILGFFVNLLIRMYRVQKIRRLYGEGSEGYVFHLRQENIKEANRQNQPVRGKYDTECAIRTRTGIYVGEKHRKIISHLGIPYAKPPVGELRWKAPEPLPASDAVFEAKHFGASAIQVEHKGSIIRHHRQSEDCLTLNIITGRQKTESGKPVLVLFHHGDFTCGGSVDPLIYGGRFTARHPDVVFVSFNYRLGIFGFIDFSEIPGGEARPDTLNLGLLDQVAALQWIRENIAAFGGDPDRITVLGFSSGATSILLLAATGQAKGLFQRAFVFNGSPFSAYDTPEASRNLAKNLLKETHTATMAELLQLKTETLKDAAQKLWKDMCAPTCDGTWIPADVYQALQDGAASGVEFVIGFPSSQAMVFRSLVGDRKYEDALSATAAEIKEIMEGTLSSAKQGETEAQTASSAGRDEKTKLIEQGLALTIYRTAVKLIKGGNPVHMIYWGEKPLIDNLGSGTVDAAAVLLGNDDALQMYGSVMNADQSEILQNLLRKFVHGDDLELYPNEIRGVDAIDWKAFPKALIVSDGKLQCDMIEDRIIDMRSLMSFLVS